MTNIRFGRLNLVDLAGSERLATFYLEMHCLVQCLKSELTILVTVSRQKSSGAEGERLKEAANINKSLSTLGYESIWFW